jgi:hypothetical protein
MYTFRPTTDRIKHMRQRIRDRVIEIDSERVMNITESYKTYAKMPPIIKIPLTTYDI